jgi:hypothetical protein
MHTHTVTECSSHLLIYVLLFPFSHLFDFSFFRSYRACASYRTVRSVCVPCVCVCLSILYFILLPHLILFPFLPCPPTLSLGPNIFPSFLLFVPLSAHTWHFHTYATVSVHLSVPYSSALEEFKKEMKKNLQKKTNEKDFFQLKKEIENDKKELENSWRTALGDFSQSFRKEKEKEKLFFLEFLAENYTNRLETSFSGGEGGEK